MTVCNNIHCIYSKSGICSKDIVILNMGLCAEWFDKNLVQRPVPEYQSRPMDEISEVEAAEEQNPQSEEK